MEYVERVHFFVGVIAVFRHEYLANLSEKYDQTNQLIYPILAIGILLYPYISRISL